MAFRYYFVEGTIHIHLERLRCVQGSEDLCRLDNGGGRLKERKGGDVVGFGVFRQ